MAQFTPLVRPKSSALTIKRHTGQIYQFRALYLPLGNNPPRWRLRRYHFAEALFAFPPPVGG
jgi:hypothetical protein